MDLEKFENRSNVVDTRGNFKTNDKNCLHPISPREPFFTEKNINKMQSINNGLCIIINQIYFEKEVLYYLLYIIYHVIYNV